MSIEPTGRVYHSLKYRIAVVLLGRSVPENRAVLNKQAFSTKCCSDLQ